MRASDIMTTAVITVAPETSVKDIAALLIEKRISAVPVIEDGKLVGIVSEGDLIRRAELGTARRRSWWIELLAEESRAADYVKDHGLHARDVMTRDIVTVSPGTEMSEIANLLERHHIKRVPVVDDGALVGVVSRANLLHGLTVAQPPASPPDAESDIRAALTAAFEEAGIETHLVNVVTRDGAVSLYGSVRTEAEMKAIEVALETTPGITSVDNQVTLFPDTFAGRY